VKKKQDISPVQFLLVLVGDIETTKARYFSVRFECIATLLGLEQLSEHMLESLVSHGRSGEVVGHRSLLVGQKLARRLPVIAR
jgi:hypothetical protein